jgi:archaellin
MDLNRTLLYLKLNNFSVLSLNLALKVSSNGYTSIFHALDLGQLNGTNYGVISIHDRDDSIMKTNGMSATDQAIFLVNLSAVLSETGGLLPGEVLEGTLVPDFGGSGVFVAQAPMAFKYQVCEL